MKVKKPGMSDEHHDYSEIYTPTREVSGLGWAGPGDRPESMSGSSSVRTGSGDSGVSGGSHCVNQVSQQFALTNHGKHLRQRRCPLSLRRLKKVSQCALLRLCSPLKSFRVILSILLDCAGPSDC